MKVIKFLKKYKLPAVLIACGLAIMLAAKILPQNTASTSNNASTSSTSDSASSNDFEAYATYEENRLESILSQISGAGRVEVAIYVASTPSKDENSLAFPEIKGVLVCAEGAISTSVKEKLTRAVALLYDLPLSDISVIY